MFLSVFDLFKIGLGPSSSHTMGPMTAATLFLEALRTQRDWRVEPARIRCRLYGSLAWTGKGHGTDRAIILGLAGQRPATIDGEKADRIEAEIRAASAVSPDGLPRLAFDPAADLAFDLGPPLAAHPNGMVFEARAPNGDLVLRETYFSIGGGFVASEAELAASRTKAETGDREGGFPFPFANAAEMLEMGEASGLSIAAMKRANERGRMAEADLDGGLDAIWTAMRECVERGLRVEGNLPGLGIRRRAKAMRERLEAGRGTAWCDPATDWLLVHAMAVNEENAAGGRVVTAPTNGAAGVIPAVLLYWRRHRQDASDDGVRTFLLTAAAIGGLIKHNASISGAEVGCQGEVGSAAAMAAAGLCAVLGGTNRQVENAAEIALEHHLGLTCDPARGLVQVPCIERNGLGAVKAVAAASLALHGDGSHFMPLDNCIEAMRQTGAEMSTKYKETALGGLAVNLPQC